MHAIELKQTGTIFHRKNANWFGLLLHNKRSEQKESLREKEERKREWRKESHAMWMAVKKHSISQMDPPLHQTKSLSGEMTTNWSAFQFADTLLLQRIPSIHSRTHLHKHTHTQCNYILFIYLLSSCLLLSSLHSFFFLLPFETVFGYFFFFVYILLTSRHIV